MDFPALLRENGLRATSGRVAILSALEREQKPITIEELKGRLSEELDTVTLYRALDALCAVKLVERSDLRHGHAHYELLAGRAHHHHAICRECGTIEDIEVSHATEPEKEAVRNAASFASIDAYTLEFFGRCKSCA